MNVKLNTKLAVRIFVMAYIVAVVIFYFINSYTPPSERNINVINNLSLIDTIPPGLVNYNEYNKTNDARSVYSVDKSGIMYEGGGGIRVSFIGTTSGISCDTCSIKWYAAQSFDDQPHKKYYLKLPYWKINNTVSQFFWYRDSVKFHIANGQAYVRKAIIRPQDKQKNVQPDNGYLVDIPAKFSYDPKNHYVLIPVSKSTKNIMDIILVFSAILLVAYFLYLVRSFLNFIFDISKGLAFTDKNIFRLKLIAVTFIFYPIIIFLLNLSMKLIFFSYFTTDVVMNGVVWKDLWRPMGIGLIFLLLHRAFTDGKVLKDEQDLTI